MEQNQLLTAQLLEAAPDAILLVDETGYIQLINAQAERLFGYRRDELVGELVEILVPDAARSQHPSHRHEYQLDGRPRPMGHGAPLAARRKGGTEFPAEISLSTIATPHGRMVAAAVRDVSDRLAQAQAQALLASIVESSHDAVVSRTLDGTITSWNAAAERIYGYPAAEIVGKRIFAIVPDDQHDQERELLDRIARGERIDRRRMRRRNADGRIMIVSVSISPVYDRLGRIIGAASVSRDLTKQELSEAKFQGLLEAAPDAIVGVAVDGRIVLANAQAEALLGYRRDELLGQPVETLVPTGNRPSHPQLRDRYFADPRPRPMGHNNKQLWARRKDGSEFPAEISLSSFESEDGLLVSASIRDVTDRIEATVERERLKAQAERERLESRLQQTQRLESLGQLAGGVAHDFNNLLGVILNYGEFIAEELNQAMDEGDLRWQDARRDLEQIQRAARRASALTHQLLTFGRREVVRPQVISLNAAVEEVQALLRRTLAEHVELSTSLGHDLWLVRADPGQLEQVLMNLAVNSRYAMPSGGRLVIETDNLEVDGAFQSQQPSVQPGRYVRLRVTDSGTGMPPEVAAHAFDPFFTTKPKGEGTGLGLATVYGIITQAGGHVWLRSETARGTTVTALFPVTDDAAEPPPPAVARPRRGRGETVLVVEDERALGEVTRRILERHNYVVLTTDNGPDALRLLEQPDRAIELLITDVIMPTMLGREVAERATALRPGLRVMFMSGYAEPVLTAQGTLDDGVVLLSKPFTETDLLAMVQEVLDRPVG
ncbi:PAS domain S-box protein [Pilimelia columellifera]|uniref:hybrid sensor histidine kinase/response regulator n=1 Tax=Pilimelia columellifera TaxID=706574 RepID=UPI0031E1FD60